MWYSTVYFDDVYVLYMWCYMMFFWCSHGIHVMFCDVFRMFTSNKWDVSRLSLSIHIVSVKYFMVYLGCLSSFYFYVVFFGVLVFSFLIFIYYFWLLSFLFVLSLTYIFPYSMICHMIYFLSKTILLFDEILYKIFKINVTICNVFICAWARIIYMPLKKHACIFMGVLINKYTTSVGKKNTFMRCMPVKEPQVWPSL